MEKMVPLLIHLRLSCTICAMPITKSAKKAIRSSARKRIFNVRRSRALASAEKGVHKLVKLGSVKEAEQKLALAYKAIDKAAKRGVIKKNTASRKKARLVAAIRRGK
jgi:small subunit ribosomal protein S20